MNQTENGLKVICKIKYSIDSNTVKIFPDNSILKASATLYKVSDRCITSEILLSLIY